MKRLVYIFVLFAVVTSLVCNGQRKVTPVQQTNNTILRPKKGEKIKPKVMNDSLYQDSLRMDSIKKIYPKYPAITDLTVGVNVWDPLMRIFGQKHGLVDFSLTLNMWNRLFPTIEVGLGKAHETPDGKNYTYDGKMSVYGKIGANYNFLFKSSKNYLFMAVFRIGYSSFKYDITNITAKDGYWGWTEGGSILNQKGSCVWAELLLGLRVKLVGNLSAGWYFKYNMKLKMNDGSQSNAWYIPGYGTRNTGITGSFSIYYTIPIKKKRWPKVDENGHLIDATTTQTSEGTPPAEPEPATEGK